MRERIGTPLLVGLLVSLEAGAEGYYLCKDPQTGRQTAQDFPCRTGQEVRSYAPASPEEQKMREAASRQYKREFERLHPGTYRPEEYMTEAELAAYYADREAREAERRKREDEAAIREATRRAAQAEQRAAGAERAAQEAKARATAAEEAAARTPPPVIVVPRPVPKPYPRPRCDREDCREEPPRREPREPPPSTGKRTCEAGKGLRCP